MTIQDDYLLEDVKSIVTGFIYLLLNISVYFCQFYFKPYVYVFL